MFCWLNRNSSLNLSEQSVCSESICYIAKPVSSVLSRLKLTTITHTVVSVGAHHDRLIHPWHSGLVSIALSLICLDIDTATGSGPGGRGSCCIVHKSKGKFVDTLPRRQDSHRRIFLAIDDRLAPCPCLQELTVGSFRQRTTFCFTGNN